MATRAEKKKAAALEPFSVLSDDKSPLTEAFRTIRANLLFTGVDAPRRKLLVASAVRMEGKTTTVANLGMTMALAGSKTLIIDTDLRRPKLHRFFQFSSKVGLTSVLGDQAEIRQAIQGTKLADLSVLPSGPSVANPAELLGSRRMAEMVNHLEQQYDILVFDSPPVIPVADALVLVGLSDGVLLVVRSGGAPYKVVSRARSQLDGVKANILGVLLNAFDFRREGYYSPYSYYYGYGYDDTNTDGHKAR